VDISHGLDISLGHHVGCAVDDAAFAATTPAESDNLPFNSKGCGR
jgi:hypothetical protein